jgi:hypothetical protein
MHIDMHIYMYIIILVLLFFFFGILGVELRALHLPSRCSPLESLHQPISIIIEGDLLDWLTQLEVGVPTMAIFMLERQRTW